MKKTKRQAGYGSHGPASRSCRRCRYFYQLKNDNGRCKVVAGKINPSFTSRLFNPK